MMSYVVVLHLIVPLTVLLTSLIDPSAKLFFAKYAKHILYPLLPLLGDLFDIRKVIV